MSYQLPQRLNRDSVRRLHFFIRDPLTFLCTVILVSAVFLAVVGPSLAPYEGTERLYRDGSILRSASPSLDHPLGTTDLGYDVLSRLMIGARPTVIAGLIGGSMIVSIGSFIGLVSGYYGGTLGNILMRITDVAYSIPVIPFAIVLGIVLGRGFFSSVAILGLIFWRSTARVIRSQTMQIKQRPFITAAKASGASDIHVITKHIVPNAAPMMALYFAIGIGATIIVQAGLAFVGVANPFVASWGVMIRNAFASGNMIGLWWWSIPPGLCLSLTVSATYLLGRKYELESKQAENGASIAQGGA